MAISTRVIPHTFRFTFDAGTSRGVLRKKESYFIQVWDSHQPNRIGVGEVGPLPGLSIDHIPNLANEIDRVLENIEGAPIPNHVLEILSWVQAKVPNHLPSVQFALETALLDWFHGGTGVVFPSAFTEGKKQLEINGLIWMGDADTMAKRVEEKLAAGFHTLKMKIGAIDFESELNLLAKVRERFGPNDITLRVDANGAFSPVEAEAKLQALAAYHLHSIEQPIRAGQHAEMAALCRQSPVPIALDEELIGVVGEEAKRSLLTAIRPPYIILKPTLLGGIEATQQWISIAEKLGIAWWMTSALESNVGLSAIAQLTATYNSKLPQGLGTGQLYHQNIASPLHLQGEWLSYLPGQPWNFTEFFESERIE